MGAMSSCGHACSEKSSSEDNFHQRGEPGRSAGKNSRPAAKKNIFVSLACERRFHEAMQVADFCAGKS
jgi:hypothetical protein